MEMTAQALAELIEREFAGTAYPGDAKIAQERVDFSDYEGNTVKAFFQGKRWQEITRSTLDNDCLIDPSSCLSFLQPEGFCYYLPAFIKIALDFDDAGEIADSISHFLVLPGAEAQEDDKSLFFARIAGMSDAQKAAIVSALEFLSTKYQQAGYPDDPAADALRSYWKRN